MWKEVTKRQFRYLMNARNDLKTIDTLDERGRLQFREYRIMPKCDTFGLQSLIGSRKYKYEIIEE